MRNLFLGYYMIILQSFNIFVLNYIVDIESIKNFINAANSFEEVENLIFSGQMVI